MIKKILGVGSLTILTIFQLNAVMGTQKITIEFSGTASRALGISSMDNRREVDVIPNLTTAGNILEKIAVDDNTSTIRMDVLPSGEFVPSYVNKRLKDAYDNGLLSLWTIKPDTHPKDEIFFHEVINPNQHGYKLYLRYDV